MVPRLWMTGADLGILVGRGLTLFAIRIIYLQHLFSKFHYQLGSPGGGGKPLTPPLDPSLNDISSFIRMSLLLLLFFSPFTSVSRNNYAHLILHLISFTHKASRCWQLLCGLLMQTLRLFSWVLFAPRWVFGNGARRRFYAVRQHCICFCDNSWMYVVDKDNAWDLLNCPYDNNVSPVPAFKYAAGTTAEPNASTWHRYAFCSRLRVTVCTRHFRYSPRESVCFLFILIIMRFIHCRHGVSRSVCDNCRNR